MQEIEREIDITNLKNEFQELLESGSTIYLYKSKELVAILDLSKQNSRLIDIGQSTFIGCFYISMWSKEEEYIGLIVFDKITVLESIWKGSCVNDK